MADKAQIMDAIEALAVHCRPPIMSTEQRTIWLREWADDLCEFPMEAITNATRRWRQSGNTKFPTSGQLLPLIRECVPRERGIDRPWRPATEAEYRAMTVREKIREQMILAHEAAGKAKPMFLNTSTKPGAKASGVHLTKDQMPPEHHHWLEVAAGHHAEIKRLREYIGSPALSEAA